MRLKRLILLFAALVMLALCACAAENGNMDETDGNDGGNQQIRDSETDDNDVSVNGDVVVSANTVGKNFTAGDGKIILVATVSVPEIDDEKHPEASQAINDYYALRIDNHLAYAEYELMEYADYAYSNRGGAEFIAYTTEEFFTVEFNSNGYISFLRNIVETTGEEYSQEIITAETFEMEEGGLVTGAYMFSVDTDTAAGRITDIILSQYDNMNENEKAAYVPDFEQALKTCFNLDSFYLTNEGIVYYFQNYQLTLMDENAAEFVIPYDEVKDIFTLW